MVEVGKYATERTLYTIKIPKQAVYLKNFAKVSFLKPEAIFLKLNIYGYIYIYIHIYLIYISYTN